MKRSKIIARNKIYLDRSRVYVSYIQLAMILKVFLTSIGIESNVLFGIFVIVAIFGLRTIGWLDTRLGIRKRELENHSEQNPVAKESRDNTRKILKMLKYGGSDNSKQQ